MKQYGYMLMFSLGPVQPFIAQARKTRDLWLGSFLLSKLMEAALKDLKNQDDMQLIFPSNPVIKGTIPDIPNKYVAIFDEADQAEKAATRSQDAIYSLWNDICKDVRKEVFQENQAEDVLKKVLPESQPQDMSSARIIWDRQINPETLFEIFWVIVQGDECHYHDWLENTQLAFDARKRLRDFSHLFNQNAPNEPVHEVGEKSTISGSREALHGNDLSRDGARAFWRALAKNFSDSDLNQEGEERLDAIDTVKRFAFHSPVILNRVYSQTFSDEDGHLRIGYPSTSSIATAPYVERLLQQLASESSWSGIEVWRSITKEYRTLSSMPPHTLPYLKDRAGDYEDLLRRDGDCYFPDTFTVNRLDKSYRIHPVMRKEPSRSGKDLAVYERELAIYKIVSDSHSTEVDKLAKNGSKALSGLLQATNALGITPPTPYYAMIQMDGDRMGMLLGKVDDYEKHQDISQALSTFSRDDAPRIVEKEYPARLIYAGGDDVFALSPLGRDIVGPRAPGALYSVFGLVDRLQASYCKALSNAIDPDQPALVKGVSASVGIAIAHHYTALSYVRRVAKAAEDLAKHRYGRNALVVSVIRRSGEQTTVGCHWRYPTLPENFAQPLALFEQFFDLFKQDYLSPKCTYILLEEAPALIGMHDKLAKIAEKASALTGTDDKSAEISQQKKPDYEKDARVSEINRVLLRQRDEPKIQASGLKLDFKLLAQNIVVLADAIDDEQNEQGHLLISKKDRALELHSDSPRRGLIEMLGWLQVMVFLTRKGQE